MDEDAEICRVCRCGATPEQPLFHPCKCSGSIRHVHQDCLTEWLSHSRKKYCELCEHPFSFTPVYRSDMPDTLPATLFIKQVYKKLVFLVCTAARATIVSSVWLIVLPYLTVWTWRFYLWSGENLAYRLSDFQNINIINTTTETTTITATATAEAASSSTSSTVASLISSSSSTLLPLSSDASSATITAAADLFHDAHQSITTVFPHSIHIEKMLKSFNSKTFLADCFEGQIITCIVVIAFVAAFLLREWIIQNIPAELEDDDDEEEEEERVEIMDETIELDELDEEQYHQLQQQHDPQFDDAPTNEALDRRREAIYELQQNELYQRIDHDLDGLDQQQQHQQQESGDNNIGMGVDDPYPKPSSSASSSSDTHRSMEPGYSQSSEGETSDTEEAAAAAAAATPTVARGEPPNAPIMRHVDHHFDIRAAGQRRAMLFEEQVNGNDMLLPAPADQRNGRVPPQQPQNNNAVNNNNNPPAAENDDNDVDEENLGDDIDGILEAIGMRGNYWMLAQNSALMSLLISLCLGAAVWMPFVVGIMFIMATPFEAASSLLWLVRKVTDPLLDTVFMICTTYLWPSVSALIQTQERLFSKFVPQEALEYIYETIVGGVTKIQSLIQQVYPFDNTVITTTNTAAATATTSSSALITGSSGQIYPALSNLLPAMVATIPTNWTDAQMIFSQLIEQQIKPSVHDALVRYHGFATGHTAFDRFVCIVVGYAVIITGSSWYLSRAHVAYATFGRSARQVVRQQGIILKVAMFIAIELLLFPIVCGILLDVSSFSLFRDATIDSRLAYLKSHPLASVFLHWFFGTAFMFFFAILVTVCREIVRPGVLWFIRDPNDPQFHPIKEIVERPVLTQLQKIGASGITYACVIVAGVGGMVWCLGYAGKDILPLRWNMLQPLSTLPIDFLAVHILIPALVKYFEPKRVLKTLTVQWMRFLARKLRLTSFLFGERHASEEGVWHYKTWSAWLHPPSNLNPLVGEYSEAAFIRDGQIVLAPKHDAVPFDPTRRMLVPVHPETLHILDPTERRLGHPAAAGGPNLLTINTCIVYIPPRFKQRMTLFLLAMWTSCSMFICTLTVLPIALGRIVFERWLEAPGEVHDLYAYFVGATLMLFGLVSICKIVDAVMDLARQASSSSLLRRIYFYMSGTLCWIGKVTYLSVALGIIVPLMLGSLVELYFIMPLQDYGSRAPTVEVVAMWTRGIACMSTLHGVIHLGPENRWRDQVNMVFQPNVRVINLRAITTNFIAPIIAATLLMTILPFSMALANIKLLGEEDPGRQIKMIQIMYPAALVSAAVYYLCRVGAKFGETWVQAVREDNYLVGRTLHNFDN